MASYFYSGIRELSVFVVILVSVCLTVLVFGRGCGRRIGPQPLVRSMKQTTALKHVFELGRAIERINSETPYENISAVLQRQDDTLAAAMAWRRAVESSLREHRNIIPVEEIYRFCGFVEGRLHAELPEYWINSLKDNILQDSGKTFFAMSIAAPKFVDVGKGLLMPEDQSVEFGDDVWIIHHGPNKVRILSSEFANHAKSDRYFLCSISQNCCAVAFHDDLAGSFDVFCIDPLTFRIRWIANVWGWSNFMSPPVDRHRVQLKINDERGSIDVFAECGEYQALESFSQDDGTPLFRFSTTSYSAR